MNDYPTKYVRLDAMPGSLVDRAVDTAVAKATELRAPVKIEFNGVDIVAYPGDSVDWVFKTYGRERQLRQEEAAAKKAELQADKLLTSVLLVINQDAWTHAQLREALAK